MNTREEWLTEAAERMRPMFEDAGVELWPRYRIGLGFTSRPMKAIGQCWAPEASADGSRAIFIAPMLDGPAALSTLAHELCHACLPNKAGHKAPFKRLGTAIGLEGKPTHMHAGAELQARLNAMMEDAGPYPHAALDPSASGRKKQTTRLLKVTCTVCGYTFRTTAKWAPVTSICPAAEEHEDQENMHTLDVAGSDDGDGE